MLEKRNENEMNLIFHSTGVGREVKGRNGTFRSVNSFSTLKASLSRNKEPTLI